MSQSNSFPVDLVTYLFGRKLLSTIVLIKVVSLNLLIHDN